MPFFCHDWICVCVLCLGGGNCKSVTVYLLYFHCEIYPGALFVGGSCSRLCLDDVYVYV